MSYFGIKQRFSIAKLCPFPVGANNLLDKDRPMLALPTGFIDLSTYETPGAVSTPARD